MAGRAVEGDRESSIRRYAGKVVAGGVDGGLQGGAHGAVIGAVREVGIEAAKDSVKGAAEVTGGGPDAKPADERGLGAGGTGYARGSAKADKGTGSKGAKGVAVGGAAVAAPPALGVLMTMALLNWLKSMFFASMALAANAANALWMFLVNVAKAVGHAVAAPFVAIGGFIANTAGAVLGVAVGAAVAPVAAAASGVTASVAAIALMSTVVTGVIDQTSLTEGRISSSGSACVVDTRSDSASGVGVSVNTEDNAKAVYSVLSSWGMPDENIAGILGNWSQESGIDPTSVEAVFDEPYRIGPRKQAAWDGNFTHIPGQTHGGIGLGQWSNGRTLKLLRYAEAKGLDWYTVQAQLAFMVEGDNPSDVAVFKDMITTSQGSPSAAAIHFHDRWERSADNAAMMAERSADAEMWFGRMSGWVADDSVASGVEDIVGGIVAGVSNGISTILGNCAALGEYVGLTGGGMSEADAQALVDLYNAEGDQVLRDAFNGGGPGQCNGSYIENCVSFSWYFIVKYTSYKGGYAPGNGVDVARSMAGVMGKETTNTPTPYSVFSHGNTSTAGHTGVVLAVEGDRILIGEAAYCQFPGRARWVEVSEWKDGGWEFVDVSDMVGDGGNDADGIQINNANAAQRGRQGPAAVG
ncbi:phage tail tip lysozyme [Promicromonospora vindobonensis]|uniref:Phage tail tip lysozyme n=1 Tax=Promicromonospora vindobonensis TaxID=195748 RepID=A0ABW5VX65_9MICO